MELLLLLQWVSSSPTCLVLHARTEGTIQVRISMEVSKPVHWWDGEPSESRSRKRSIVDIAQHANRLDLSS